MIELTVNNRTVVIPAGGTVLDAVRAGGFDLPTLCHHEGLEPYGACAIEFMGRGESRRVGTPFNLQAGDCIGCGACAEVCPTGAIRIEDRGGLRILHTWDTRMVLKDVRTAANILGQAPWIL